MRPKSCILYKVCVGWGRIWESLGLKVSWVSQKKICRWLSLPQEFNEQGLEAAVVIQGQNGNSFIFFFFESEMTLLDNYWNVKRPTWSISYLRYYY